MPFSSSSCHFTAIPYILGHFVVTLWDGNTALIKSGSWAILQLYVGVCWL